MTNGDWDVLDDDGRAWLSSTLAVSQTAPDRGEQVADLRPLLVAAVEIGASDLHLSAGCVPHVRVSGELRPLRGEGPLAPRDLDAFVISTLDDAKRAVLSQKGDLDTALEVRAGDRSARLRASFFRQSDSLAAAFRVVPSEVPALEVLGLPPVVRTLAERDRGLVLVTGRTGSGKSTTLAAMIDMINRTRSTHIVTIEDPIEFRHFSQASIIQQREVGTDTESFAVALRHSLRQDPDVIMLGELRDLETIRIALTAAETGHLVLATLHSTDTPGAIHRLIDVFPAGQQMQIRSQLALSLQGIITQELISIGTGLVAATETLIATDAVRNLIREEKVHQLRSVLETGAEFGMQTMQQSRVSLGLAVEGRP